MTDHAPVFATSRAKRSRRRSVAAERTRRTTAEIRGTSRSGRSGRTPGL